MMINRITTGLANFFQYGSIKSRTTQKKNINIKIESQNPKMAVAKPSKTNSDTTATTLDNASNSIKTSATPTKKVGLNFFKKLGKAKKTQSSNPELAASMTNKTTQNRPIPLSFSRAMAQLMNTARNHEYTALKQESEHKYQILCTALKSEQAMLRNCIDSIKADQGNTESVQEVLIQLCKNGNPELAAAIITVSWEARTNNTEDENAYDGILDGLRNDLEKENWESLSALIPKNINWTES